MDARRYETTERSLSKLEGKGKGDLGAGATHEVLGEDLREELLVPLHGLPGARPQRRAADAHVPACGENPP